MKRYRQKLLTLAGSALLAGAVVAIILFVPLDGAWTDAERIVTAVFAGVWMFSCIPAYLFTFAWAKARSEKSDPVNSFWEGYRWGYFFGFLLFFLPLILSPGLALFYYLPARP